MADQDKERSERVQAILSRLLERRLTESLTELDHELGAWRAGDKGVFEAHAQVLRHAARTERLAERMARLGPDSAAALLRDAFEADVIGREEFVELAGKEPEEVEPLPALDEEQPRALPAKKGVMEELMQNGPVLVHIDARRDDVDVPGQFRDDPKLVLRFGYDLSPAIVDLTVDDEGLAGTLTFGGVPHRCTLPWPAIYAVVSEVDQKGMVWPEDVPAEAAAEREAPAEEDKPARRGGHLKLVK